MRFIVSLLLLFPLTLEAQIVSSSDGGLHFFSALVPRDSALPAATRMYRYSASGLTVEATLQIDPVVDILGTLDASTDGKVVAYWSLRHSLSPNPFCTGPCYYSVTYTSKVISGSDVHSFDRPVSLSSDGRFAVLADATAPPARIDLTTGDRTTAPAGTLTSSRQAITADGRLLLSLRQNDSSVRLFLWSPAEQRDVATLPLAAAANPYLVAVISPNGSKVAWTNTSEKTVHAIDVSTGLDTVIATAASSVAQLSIDDAGDVVSFTAGNPRQLYLAHTDGSSSQVFGGTPEGVSDATIQHDGAGIYALTAASRMLRIDTASGAATEIWQPPPVAATIFTPPLRLAPGSYQRITGYSLNSDVSIGNVPMQVLFSTPQEIHFQVPFDAPETTGFLRFKSDSPLEQSFPAQIHPISPRFLTFWDAAISTNPYNTIVIHGDYSGFVSPDSPAHLGETLHFYMSGLGPVMPAVSTGVPSPSNPPAMITSGLHVSALEQDVPIVFAGLAPQLTGVYLLSVHLPETLEAAIRAQTIMQPATLYITVREDGATDATGVIFSLQLP